MKSVHKFKITKSNHLIIDCKINDENGRFVLDTGASNSCISIKNIKKFNLTFEKSNQIASSATNEIDDTYISRNNNFKIGKFKRSNIDFILFDMSHINNLFNEENIKEVDGIIGSDFLKEFHAIIDYNNKLLTL